MALEDFFENFKKTLKSGVQRPIREVENSGLRVAGLLPVRDVR
jgi:hypothetical protein